jgi:hypothetical protein
MMAAAARVPDMFDPKDLEPLSERLNAASDELSQNLQVIQDRLNGLGIELEAWVSEPLLTSDWRDILDRNLEPTRYREYSADELGYGRTVDGWALIVRTRRYVEGPNEQGFNDTDIYISENSKTLLHASRELRFEAVRLLPALIETLQSQAKNVIDRVEQVKKNHGLAEVNLAGDANTRSTASLQRGLTIEADGRFSFSRSVSCTDGDASAHRLNGGPPRGTKPAASRPCIAGMNRRRLRVWTRSRLSPTIVIRTVPSPRIA